MLEEKVNDAKAKLLEAYGDVKTELKKYWNTYKHYYPTAATAGICCGILARLGAGSSSVAFASAAFSPLVFADKLYGKVLNYQVIAIGALEGYYAGFILTDIAMKVLFPDQVTVPDIPAELPVAPTPSPRPRMPWPDTTVV